MIRPNFGLSVASVLAMGLMAAGAARAEDAKSAIDAQIAPLQAEIDESRAALKQVLATGLDREQMESAFNVIENFVSSYSKMSLIDSSAANDGVMSIYLQGKLIPSLQAIGVTTELDVVSNEVRGLTRNAMEIAKILDSEPAYASEATDETGNETRRGR